MKTTKIDISDKVGAARIILQNHDGDLSIQVFQQFKFEEMPQRVFLTKEQAIELRDFLNANL